MGEIYYVCKISLSNSVTPLFSCKINIPAFYLKILQLILVAGGRNPLGIHLLGFQSSVLCCSSVIDFLPLSHKANLPTEFHPVSLLH